MRALMLGGRQP